MIVVIIGIMNVGVWLLIGAVLFFLALSLFSSVLNWYIGVPQAKRAMKICPFVSDELLCRWKYHEQIPAVWIPKLFK